MLKTTVVSPVLAPDLDGLALPAGGIESSLAGIRVDRGLRTTVQGVWAVGGVTGEPCFANQSRLQARIAVDVMVRILEKRDHLEHVAPRVVLVDGANQRDWDSSTTLAPRGFRPIFSINQ